MNRNKNIRSSAPLIAIVMIVLGYIAAQYWLLPPEEAPEAPRAVPPATTPEILPPVAAPEAPVTNSWPLYHGGLDLCGNADVEIPDAPVRVWQYFAEGAVKQSPVGDEHGIYLATHSGTVISLDFEGRERWTKRLTWKSAADAAEKQARLEAPVACIRSTVLVGSTAGIVHALDSATGAERWTYDVGGDILGSVNAYDSGKAGEAVRVFVIERSEGVLHCIDLDTGGRLWQSEPINRADGSAAVGDGIVVYGSCDAAIHVYSVFDGRLMRSVALCGDCQVAAGVALVGDDVFAGCRSGRFYRVNAKVGSVRWTNQDSAKDVFTTPAVGKGIVAFGSDDGFVYALDRDTGKSKWRFKTNGIPSSPVFAGDKLITGSKGVLRILAAETGEEIWNYEVSDEITSPSIINGLVMVGSEDGAVTAFGAGPNQQSAR